MNKDLLFLVFIGSEMFLVGFLLVHGFYVIPIIILSMIVCSLILRYCYETKQNREYEKVLHEIQSEVRYLMSKQNNNNENEEHF